MLPRLQLSHKAAGVWQPAAEEVARASAQQLNQQ